jgi:hypothetical protein
MSFLGWMALGGLVLLLMALSSTHLRNLPISTSAIYLALDVAIGPLGFASPHPMVSTLIATNGAAAGLGAGMGAGRGPQHAADIHTRRSPVAC